MQPPLLSIALLSSAALAYQVLLTRLFAVIQWHHLAFMIISLALLGVGASGTLLSILGDTGRRHFRWLYPTLAMLFGLSAFVAFLVAQRLPFNVLELGWSADQLWYLLAQYLVLAIPFLFAASGIGLALVSFRDQRHRIYGSDLLGAGAGALGMILLLLLLPPLASLLMVCLIGLAAARLAVVHRLAQAVVLIMALVLVVGFAHQRPSLQLSDYKALSLALEAVGAERVGQRSGPLGLVSVVENRTIPIRHAPGLSLNASAGPPAQLGLFVDGEPAGAITRFNGEREPLQFLDQLDSALPYHLLDRPTVLVLGAGGGLPVLQAWYHDARLIDAVELNPQLVRVVRDDFADFAGDLYEQPGIRVHIADPRHFAATTRRPYDLIQLPLADAGSGGLRALQESYRYTVEALHDYYQRLAEGGILALSGSLESPPRSAPKAIATAIEALKRAEVTDPAQQLVVIRSWRHFTLLIKRGEFTPEQLETVKAFSEQRSFDLAYLPDLDPALVNRFNVLPEDYLHRATLALLGPESETFHGNYKFNIRPATDDRPYFYHFFRWQVLPELWSARARGGMGQLEWGYLVLVATLLQALLASLILILLPLILRRRSGHMEAAPKARILGYFIALGLGFLLLEIAFIQKLILFLGHPLYAIAVVLAAFLVWAGLGSLCAGMLQHHRLALPAITLLIAILATLYLLLLPGLLAPAADWPTTARLVLTALLIGPLAFLLGMPFPLGLARLESGQIPWAWAINGCASVVAAVLALLLALAIGFSGVVLTAAGFYLLAMLAAPPLPTATEPVDRSDTR